MEPAFHRGDILFLHMGFTPFRSGDIVVFKVADREIPIVHRIIKVHEKEDGTVDLLTKGDNNAVDDRGLYAASQSWIHREHVIGRAKGCARERGTRARRQRDATPARTAHTRSRPPAPQVSTVHWDGDDHHERLPDRQVHPRRADGPVRTDDKRMSTKFQNRSPLQRGRRILQRRFCNERRARELPSRGAPPLVHSS